MILAILLVILMVLTVIRIVRDVLYFHKEPWVYSNDKERESVFETIFYEKWNILSLICICTIMFDSVLF